MTPDTDRPLPLKGPLGLRQVFFTRRSNRLITHFRARRVQLGIVLLIAVVAALLLQLWFRGWGPWHFREELWFAALWIFILSDFTAGVAVARAVAGEATRWKSLRRLSDVSITLLRPVAVAQLIIAPAVRNVTVLIVLLYVGFAAALLRHRPQEAAFLLPYGLIALNAVITVYMSAWAQVTITLGSSSQLAAFFALSHFTAVCVLTLAPTAFIPVHAVMTTSIASDWEDDRVEAALLVAIPPMALAIAFLKCLYARAFAARFEQVVLPRLSL